MFHLIIFAVLAAFGALLSATLMTDVQRRIARWLRDNGLADSALMDAIVLLDKIGSGIKVSIRVATTQRSEVLTLEKTYSIDQIKDAGLRAELEQRQHAERNVMSLIHEG